MSTKRRGKRAPAVPGSFVGCLRHFLSPDLFKQAHAAFKPSRDCRWTLHALVLTLAVFTWCAGDSQEERFEVARAFYVDALAPKRKRPGKTVEGFRAAVARLPLAVLAVFAAGMRRALLLKLRPWLRLDGFIPIGCDGSRLACPRTAQLEQHLGSGGKKAAGPQMWVTAMVHLSTGLLWSWQTDKATASERDHLRQLLPSLPQDALVVTDAGYYGAELARSILASGADFLIRMSSKSTLFAELTPGKDWTDGPVMLWTKRDQDAKRPPLFLRLIRLREPRRKVDVWLLTSVLQPTRLSVESASRFYRLRWENEGFFRTYKRTLKQVKLSSRSVGLIYREAEGALLAVQLLLSQGVWARASLAAKDVRCSPRGVLLLVRREIREATKKRGRQGYRRRLGDAGREDRPGRRSAKVKRKWATRDDHKPPRPPKLLSIPDELIAKLHKVLGAA
jgi:hypothetical protein